MFYLKQYDTTLLSFEIIDDNLEGQKCRIHSINRDNSDLFPIGLKETDDGLQSWLRSRIIPKNREYVDALLAKRGLSHNDLRGILQVCLGLSLNDSYWVVEDGFEGTFSEYNLYEHDFVKALSLIAYTGYGSSKAKGFLRQMVCSARAGVECVAKFFYTREEQAELRMQGMNLIRNTMRLKLLKKWAFYMLHMIFPFGNTVCVLHANCFVI